ncbi:hypothetical protein, partial [Streptomyces sp. NPDC014792]|uniref:hypothetical protein n=1 Tax=Streptomyces sp. NPDC014792 TaxID=3364913 RepID=UPI0037009E48
SRVHTESARRFLSGSTHKKHRIRDAPIVPRNRHDNLRMKVLRWLLETAHLSLFNTSAIQGPAKDVG